MIGRRDASVFGSVTLIKDQERKGVVAMKNTGLMGAVAASLCLLACAAWGADAKFAVINLDRAFSEYYKTKLADAQLKQQAEEFNEERKKLVDEYEKLQQEFGKLRDESQNIALSESVRNAKRDQAEDKLIELRDYESRIRRFDETRRKQLDDQSRRMRKRIVDEILQVVNNYSKVQGFQWVVDSSAQSLNGVETVLYVDPKMDITDDILNELNKGKETSN
jgi:outer membrane protein